MKFRLLTIIVVIIALFSVSVAIAQDQTIAEIVGAQAETGEFTTLLAAVQAADPAVLEALSGDGELTVFAPTDAAFAELPQVVIDYLLAHPDLLTQVLLYHVVDGRVTSDDVTTMLADNDGTVNVTSMDMGNELLITSTEDGIAINHANVDLGMADIEASNGIIHVIDSVLIPAIDLSYEDPAFVEGDIVSEGSSTVTPLTETMMSNYRQAAGGDSAAINPSHTRTGSGDGIAAFCAGEIDIANASRPIKDTEIETCQANGLNPIGFRVGTDGIAVVVSPANDWADDVTLEELAAIFSTATTWADVRAGWPEEDILRYTPGDESGTYDFFNEVVFESDESIPAAASNLTTNSDDNVLLLGASENVNGASYFGYAYYVNNQDALKLLSINGVQPNAASVEDGSYALARPLYLYTDANIIAEKPEVGEFIRYYLATVNDVIEGVGYFAPSEAGLNLAKLTILALTEGAM